MVREECNEASPGGHAETDEAVAELLARSLNMSLARGVRNAMRRKATTVIHE